MRGALRGVVAYFSSLATGIAAGWNAFWYTPADPTLLGLIRILTGLMLLYTHAVWGLALNDFFGPDAWISRELVDAVQANQFAYSLWWHIPPRWIWPAYAGMMLILALFAAGLWTFSLIMLVGCASFLPPEGVARWVAAITAIAGGSRRTTAGLLSHES